MFLLLEQKELHNNDQSTEVASDCLINLLMLRSLKGGVGDEEFGGILAQFTHISGTWFVQHMLHGGLFKLMQPLQTGRSHIHL